MAIDIRIEHGPAIGPWRFADDVQEIGVGRDPASCQVVFPADLAMVGRRHLGMRQQLGRYRLVLNDRDVVDLDGAQALDGQEIPEAGAMLRLGSGESAPRIWVVPSQVAPGLISTLHQDGKITQRGALSRLSRRVRIGALATLGLAAALLALWRIQGDLGERVRATDASVAGLDQRTRAGLADLLRRSEAADPALLARVVEAAQPSVLLVLLRDAEGKEDPVGTAWVVAPGKLATNAHVALAVEEDAEHTMIVRSSEAPFAIWQVTGTVIHPDFERFDELLSEYGPVQQLSGGYREMNDLVTVCDVALLAVEGSSELPPPLEVAGAKRMRTLAPGDELALVGFPMEGLAGGGVSITSPTPTAQFGRITAVTDAFLGKPSALGAERDDGVLVQHSIPSTGGSSGSPILDRSGRVVAVHSAGNMIMDGRGRRAPSAALINYGQRADLVVELLRETEDLAALSQLRATQWREDLRQFASANDPDFRRELVLEQFAEAVGGKPELVRRESQTLGEALPAEMAAEGFDHGALTRIVLPAGRAYLLIASSQGDADPQKQGDQHPSIELFVLSTRTQALLASDAGEPHGWFRAAMLEPLREPEEVVVIVRGGLGATLDASVYSTLAPVPSE